MTMMVSSSSKDGGQFGDTRLTKVFVGGLAWETPIETLREHFEKFGEIVEAVIISDKLTGRSKGYGFVTFKEAEAAKKACEEPSAMIINGRRANCNLASLGARRPTPHSSNSPAPPQPKGSNGIIGALRNSNQVQCYYPVTPTPPPPAAPAPQFHHHPLPFCGYAPSYIATNVNYNYNQKLSYGSGGIYMNGYMTPPGGGGGVYPSGAIVMPMYPHHIYQYPYQTMGVAAAHIYHPTTLPAHFATLAPSITAPNTVEHTGTVGTGECFKRVA